MNLRKLIRKMIFEKLRMDFFFIPVVTQQLHTRRKFRLMTILYENQSGDKSCDVSRKIMLCVAFLIKC